MELSLQATIAALGANAGVDFAVRLPSGTCYASGPRPAYGQAEYRRLKQRYDPQRCASDLYDKCVLRA